MTTKLNLQKGFPKSLNFWVDLTFIFRYLWSKYEHYRQLVSKAIARKGPR